MDVVRCAGCERPLDERPDIPVEKRTPCPNCSSTARTIEASASLGRTRTRSRAIGTALETDTALPIKPLGGASPTGRASAAAWGALTAALAERKPDHVRTYCLRDLSDGMFLAEVLDENGTALGQGVGDNEDDAILGLVDHLMRSEEADE